MEYIKAEDRVGIERENNNGTKMKIIKVLPNDRIIVQFQDDFKFEKEIHWNNFKRGTVKNPYDRVVFGIGYIGVGKYKARESKDKLDIKYNIWKSMLNRCYSDTTNQYPAYKGCSMCKEWHNFQVFAKWYEENYYDVDDEKRMHVDKDIICKGNKIYCPEYCMLVPQRINMIFMQKSNQLDLPNGIHMTPNGKYQSDYNTKYLGVFDNLEDAVIEHDKEKRIHIKEIVKEYGNKLPDRVREALLRW